MKKSNIAVCLFAAALVSLAAGGLLFANLGPFIVKYPSGEPAAKGVLARLDPDLKPGREERLKVVKEMLSVAFNKDVPGRTVLSGGTPLVTVTAAYTIENPADQEVQADFGFPILRGIYQNQVNVTLGAEALRPAIISESVIYGVIRHRARAVIDKAVAADAALGKLSAAMKAGNAKPETASDLKLYLTKTRNWNQRDSALMVEYLSLDFGKEPNSLLSGRGPESGGYGNSDANDPMVALIRANLGPLAAIGEQRATQFFARLATCLDPNAGAGYEAIFSAWGGDVKERSVDVTTGKVRPREYSVQADPGSVGEHRVLSQPRMGEPGKDSMYPILPPREVYPPNSARVDYVYPTIYARVDYFDETARITDAQKASCKNILPNLPVVFTFAPMNLVHYQARFPAKSTKVLTVTYKQYAYRDTAAPASYQLAYVVHPATMWKDFGPINLEVTVPRDVAFRASVEGVALAAPDTYQATLKDKTGEVYFAVDAASWDKATGNFDYAFPEYRR